MSTAEPGTLAPLAILHPSGFAERTMLLDHGSIERDRHRYPAGSCELVLVRAPEGERCRAEWVADAITRVAQVLAADGLAFFFLPPRLRSVALRESRRCELRLETAVLHKSTGGGSVIPLSRQAARYAASALGLGSRGRRRLARIAALVPGSASIIRRAAPGVALVLRRPGARPLAAWVFEDAAEKPGSVLVQLNWREPPTGMVLHCFPRGARAPVRIAKVGWSAERAEKLAREAQLLELLRPRAHSGQVQLPATIALRPIGPYTALVQTAVPGRAAAIDLRGSERRFRTVIELLTGWLETWGASSRYKLTLESAFWNARVFQPLESIDHAVPNAAQYRAWLEAETRSLSGVEISGVATHNDLTMWNVLRQGDNLSVVDWEEAELAGVPMTDFYYAAVDAAAAMDGYRDRLKALRACFAATGALSAPVRERERRLRAVLGVPERVALLCFHICWLHHARNEARAAASGDRRRPFLEIVTWLASRGARDELIVGT